MPATDTVTPGEWYYDTDTDERAAVVAIETWAGADVAILQYEDGVMWDEGLVDGALPDPYEPFPTDEDAPTVEDACSSDQHVFAIEPAKRPPENPMCAACRLSTGILVEIANQPPHDIRQQYPVVCHYCATTLEPGEDRQFREDIVMCPSCYEAEWDEYAQVPSDHHRASLLVCEHSPLAPGDDDHEPCGFLASPTPERTERFVRAPGAPTTAEPDPCPTCGGSVQTVSLQDWMAAAFASAVDAEPLEEPTASPLVALTGDDPVVLDADTLAELEATLDTQRALHEQRRRERDLEWEREQSVFETFPVGKLRPVQGPATDILRNAEPGCEVIGWPTTGRRHAVDPLEQILDLEGTADDDTLPTTEDHTPPYLVVQTRDGEPPAPETVDELLDVGYTPLDGGRGPDRGGGGWPIEAEPGYQDHPLVGAYAFRLVETADDGA